MRRDRGPIPAPAARYDVRWLDGYVDVYFVFEGIERHVFTEREHAVYGTEDWRHVLPRILADYIGHEPDAATVEIYLRDPRHSMVVVRESDLERLFGCRGAQMGLKL